MSGSSGASKQPNNIKTEINKVISRANLKTNHAVLDTAINDLVEIIDELKKQEQILEIIETVAMTSNDDSIIALRNELFTTVKLIHGDKINDTVKEMNSQQSNNIYTTDGGAFGLTLPSINHLFDITTASSATSTGGMTISSPMQVDGKTIPNCEDVEEIVRATIDKRSVWNKVKEVFSREKK